jgi:hypothetical protein
MRTSLFIAITALLALEQASRAQDATCVSPPKGFDSSGIQQLYTDLNRFLEVPKGSSSCESTSMTPALALEMSRVIEDARSTYDRVLTEPDSSLSEFKSEIQDRSSSLPSEMVAALKGAEFLRQDHRKLIEYAASETTSHTPSKAAIAFKNKLVGLFGAAGARKQIDAAKNSLERLKQKGLAISSGGGLNWEAFDWNDLGRPDGAKAFRQIFPEATPATISSLLNPARREVVVVDNVAIKPPSGTMRSQLIDAKAGGRYLPLSLTALPQTEWKRQVDLKLKGFSGAIQSAFRSTQELSGLDTLSSAIGNVYFGEGSLEATINMGGDLGAAAATLEGLRSLGLPREGVIELNAALNDAGLKHAGSVDSALNKLGVKIAAISVLPAVVLFPPKMLALFAGGLAVAQGVEGAAAGIENHLQGGTLDDWMCRWGRNVRDNIAENFLMSVAFAPLMTGGAAAMTFLKSSAKGAKIARGVQTGLYAMNAAGGGIALKECAEALKAVQDLKTEADKTLSSRPDLKLNDATQTRDALREAASLLEREAGRSCTDGSIFVAGFATKLGKILKTAPALAMALKQGQFGKMKPSVFLAKMSQLKTETATLYSNLNRRGYGRMGVQLFASCSF